MPLFRFIFLNIFLTNIPTGGIFKIVFFSKMFFEKNESGKEKSIRRIKILRGQIDGILRMLESGESCEKILPQIKATKNAFSAFSKEAAKHYFLECRHQQMSDQELESLFEAVSKM